MAEGTPRKRGLAAVARTSRGGGDGDDDGEPTKKKYCSNLCSKEAGTCHGCRSSFGWLSPEAALYMEQYMVWHTRVETERRYPPFAPGQTVMRNGTECTFLRYRTNRGRSHWCAVKEKTGVGTVHVAVKQKELSVPARICPMPPPEGLVHLHFGEREFRFLRRKFAKWSFAQLNTAADDSTNLMPGLGANDADE